MKKLLLATGLLVGLAFPALAQNTTCSDRLPTDVSNACANTRFVSQAIGGGTGTVNLTEFGGKCDGVTDDGPSAQLAHNTGKTVIYPKGTCYIATRVVLNTGYFHALGQGPGVTTLKAKAAPMPSGTSPGVNVSWNMYSLTGMSAAYFEQMTIDGNTTASTNPSTSTLSDLRVPIEIIDSFNITYDNLVFTGIKAPIFNYTVPGASATLIPQLKTGQFWIASTTGSCKNITLLNVRIKYPTFVEGGQIVNCQNIWIDNFRSFDDNPGVTTLSLATPLSILGPLTTDVWINDVYIKDHLGSAMNLGASNLKVTNTQIVGPTLYTQAITGFPLTVTTVNGNPATTITSGSCSSGGLVVSVGQHITGSGIPASTTVASCSGATLTLSANATASASGVVVTLGGGTGATDQVRYGGGIDSGEELSYNLFTDQGPIKDLEFTGNSATGVRDSCVNVYNGSALSTYNYSKVIIANNICIDAPIGFLIGGVDGFNLTNNYVNTTLGYAQVEDTQSYFTGPIGGEAALIYNSKNFTVQNNNIDAGTSASYGGITAAPRWGINTQDVTSGLVSGNTVRDYTINNIRATVSVNNTGNDLRYINNALHGTPTLDLVIGETGLAINRADIAGNTRNGVPVVASNASIFITNLDGVPLGGLVGAEALRAVPTANAVNRINATGGTTGNGPTIASAGSDTNVPLNLACQGTCNIRIPAFNVAGLIINDASGNLTSAPTLPAAQEPAHTGDVTNSVGSLALTLAAGSASVLNSGTLPAARMPALTGACTTSAGAVATTCIINTTINGGGAINTIAGGGTGWVGVGLQCTATESFCYLPQPQAGTISKFYINTSAAPVGVQTYTITMRKNATNQSVTCTITGAATSCNDTTNSFTVAAGDNVSVQIVLSATAASVGASNFGFKLATTSP